VVEQPRTLNWWGTRLNISPNTLRHWREAERLPVTVKGKRAYITAAELRAFLVANAHLPAAPRALRALETAVDAQPTGSAPAGTAPDVDPRDELRALRARVATLDAELDRERAGNLALRASRDLWRERARAHREALRHQLDLEEMSDASDGD
jgi:hypothetical protein